MISQISRGFVRAQIGERTVTIEGEGLVRMEGQPDYILYKDSIRHWDPPDGGAIDEVTREGILADVLAEMIQKGIRAEVE